MNIFQYLGLPANHRTGNNITQLVKNFDEVPDSRKPHDAIYIAEVKMDGIFCHVVKRDYREFGFFSRTGMRYTNSEFLEQLGMEFLGDIPDGVYMVELCCPICYLEALSGLYNRNRVKGLDDEEC